MNPTFRQTSTFTLAIIGGGPRCVYALERLAATCAHRKRLDALNILIFEQSGQFGDGQSHSSRQSRTSLLNRIASQVSFAADETVVGATSVRPLEDRPDLYEWCRRRFEITGETDFDVRREDYPRRYVHGLALRDMFEKFVRELNALPGVGVQLSANEVIDLQALSPGYQLTTAAGELFFAHSVLLVTGHTPHASELSTRSARFAELTARNGIAYVPYVYPLDDRITEAAAPSKSNVACVGLGLTAIDVVMHLTEGRGGRFEKNQDGGISYIASGLEPRSILAFSDVGLFTFARPRNLKTGEGTSKEHQAWFFSQSNIDALRLGIGNGRSNTGRPQLDFERHVLPLIKLEMACIHYATLFGPALGDYLVTVIQPSCSAFLQDPDGSDGWETFGTIVESTVQKLVELLQKVLSREITISDADTICPELQPSTALHRWSAVVFGHTAAERLQRLLSLPDAAIVWVEDWHSRSCLDPRLEGNRFDWERTIQPVAFVDGESLSDYQQRVLEFMRRDEIWAEQGNLDNPYKAASDGVWRDLRSVISYAIDDGGLTAESHRQFNSTYLSIHNRLANGASVEVMSRIRALIEHGVLKVERRSVRSLFTDDDFAQFLKCTSAVAEGGKLDVLLEAYVHPFDPRRESSPIYRNMLRHGICRLWRNRTNGQIDFVPGGLDLDDRHHPRDLNGLVNESITILGPASEGCRSFMLSALRPNRNHYVMRDVLTWVTGFWRQFDAKHPIRNSI
jgi:hypothetical protein